MTMTMWPTKDDEIVLDDVISVAVNNNNNNNNNNDDDKKLDADVYPKNDNENDDEDDDDDDDEAYYYQEIENELEYLSDLHQMKDRGPSQKTMNGNRRRSGRTRPLQHRHAHDFVDADADAGDVDVDIDYGVGVGVGVDNSTDTAADGNRQQRRRYMIRKRQRQRQLFNQFARAVCQTHKIPRKEVFETWAMALYVHHCFLSSPSSSTVHSSNSTLQPPIKRIADLVCSHGLLSWALLLLSSSEDEEEQEVFMKEKKKEQEKKTPTTTTKTSAVCIDVRMPKSSEIVADVFKKEFYPRFSSSSSSSSSPEQQQQHPEYYHWDYVEGPIESIVPHASTLLMGIHACGNLSDTIIDLAIASNSALALVPCCHSKKQFTLQQTQEWKKRKNHHASSKSSTVVPSLSYTLTDFIDSVRKQKLMTAGYQVREVFIPIEFTPKNRIILAIPPSSPSSSSSPTTQSVHCEKKKKKKLWEITSSFPIPIADTREAKQMIHSLSGRQASLQRKSDATPTPAFCISIWIPLPVPLVVHSTVVETSSASASALKSAAAMNDGNEDIAQQGIHIDIGTGTDTDTGTGTSVGNDTTFDATIDKDTPTTSIDIVDTPTADNTASVTTTMATVSTVNDLSVEDLQRIINQTQEEEEGVVATKTTVSPNDEEDNDDGDHNNDNNNKNNKVVADVTAVRRRTRTLRTVESVVHKPFQHKVDGRYAKTLKVYYHDCTTKVEAKQYHTRLREHIIPTYFPNVTLR